MRRRAAGPQLRRLAAGLLGLGLLAAPALADIPPPPDTAPDSGAVTGRLIEPPPGARDFARQPDVLDRFLDAVLGGPPYYNLLLLPVETDRLARLPDGIALNYIFWTEMSDDEPPVLDQVRALTGLRPQPDVMDPAYDQSALLALEAVGQLRPTDEERAKAIRLPFYTVADPDLMRHVACGAFAQSDHLLRPRHLSNMTIRQLDSAPETVRARCLAVAVLRAIGFGGYGEYAGGDPLPADLDPVSFLTAEEKFFLWLLYRLPIGADRDTLRAKAEAILTAL